MALQVEAAHAVIADLAEVERAIRSGDEPIGIVGLPRGAGSAIPGKPGDSGSGKGGHGLWSGSQEEREKESNGSAHMVRVHYIFGLPLVWAANRANWLLLTGISQRIERYGLHIIWSVCHTNISELGC